MDSFWARRIIIGHSSNAQKLLISEVPLQPPPPKGSPMRLCLCLELKGRLQGDTFRDTDINCIIGVYMDLQNPAEHHTPDFKS